MKEKDKKNILYNLALVMQLGMVMVSTILISVFLGLFLDNIFKTDIIYTVIFTIIGSIAMFRNMYVFTMKNVNK